MSASARRISRVVYLSDVDVRLPDAVARALGLTLVLVIVSTPAGLQTAFATTRRERVNAVLVNYGFFFMGLSAGRACLGPQFSIRDGSF
jgi:hypothetical protein